MLSQRALLRSGQRLAQPTRSSLNRTAFRRSESQLAGPQDNAFNREREAVKHHAEQTSDLWRKLSI
ncbi:hypothetical protein LTS18_013884 [Coniosporium uncinatum]|uniref:Uncharacterized protein n=1 Tax=Coniosporium uncinatum TaxID=93489 RepID=A0ACC3CVQ0_9PEZI|nr:hypothetical protein LTS18_013884 [Coniosporium uncinatum]